MAELDHEEVLKAVAAIERLGGMAQLEEAVQLIEWLREEQKLLQLALDLVERLRELAKATRNFTNMTVHQATGQLMELLMYGG